MTRTRVLLFLLCLMGLGTPAPAQTPNFTIQSQPGNHAPLTIVARASQRAGSVTVWNFGDGTPTVQGAAVQHTYYRPGTYLIRVRGVRGESTAWQGEAPLTVTSSGPEHAGLTLLIGRGQVTLSNLGSVLYRPTTTRYVVNGKAVSPTFNLTPGTYLMQVIQGEFSAELRLNYQTLGQNAAFEQQVLTLTNQARTQGWNCQTQALGGKRLPPLKANSVLARAALAQSAAMSLYGYFAHDSPVDGSSPMRRVQASGLQPRHVGENIATGQQSALEVVRAWLRSPGHCENIMGDFTDLGVSYVSRGNLTHWTQVFRK